ncbi:MAG TPA: nucleotidyltransferase family protein [Solirubrobacteraceae bacterium]|jgi:hypothetical protein
MPNHGTWGAEGTAERFRALHMIRLDNALSEVVAELAASGQRAILLKGPSFADWLYDDRWQRTYQDIDLAVDPATFDQSEQVLARMGFTLRPGSRHHTVWQRGPVTIELHRSLYWTRCGDQLAWEILSAETSELLICGRPVETLGPPGRLVVVCLHAAQHGRDFPHPLADLTRSIARVNRHDWKRAAELARRLGAIEPFGAGLRMCPEGEVLAQALSIPQARSREIALLAHAPPPTAVGFEQLATAERARDRLRLIVDELLPSAAFMRSWQPLARRGWLGLAAAYGWRPFWLLAKAPRGLRVWLAAHREYKRGARGRWRG